MIFVCNPQKFCLKMCYNDVDLGERDSEVSHDDGKMKGKLTDLSQIRISGLLQLLQLCTLQLL